jgi:hypothetical protein
MADIAWAMFESDRHGLEMTVGELRQLLGRDDMDAVIDTLVSAKLVRKAPRTQAVSFVHRRFNEYFLVARWLTGERVPPFEAIPTDSRYRDALVLYAEVADAIEARRLAEFCWAEIIGNSRSDTADSVAGMRSIYALRFLTEAFRAIPAPIEPFRAALGQHVRNEVSANDDILTRKIAVEAIGLLDEDDAEYVLLKALRSDNRWIIDTALSACRYLPSIPQTVTDALVLSLSFREQSWILLPDKEFSFSLGIADAFAGVRRRFNCLRAEAWLGLLVGVASIVTLELKFLGVGLSIMLFCMFYMYISATIVYVMKIARSNDRENPLQIVDNVDNLFRYSIIYFFDSFSYLLARNIKSYEVRKSSIKNNGKLSFINAILHEPFLRGALYQYGLKECAISIVRSFPMYVVFIVFVLWNGDAEKIKSISFGYLGPLHYVGDFELYLSTFAMLWLALTVWRVILLMNKDHIDIAYLFLFFRVFVFSLIIVGIPAVLLILAVKYIPLFKYVVVGVMVITMSAVLHMLLHQAIRNWLYDRKQLKEAMNRFNPSRMLIAEVFSSFATSQARLHYVRWLEKEATGAVNQVRLGSLHANPWPDGRRPNKGDDEASILLSRLDARWIGLDA